MIKAFERTRTWRLLMVLFMLRLVVSTFSVIYWKSVGTGSSSTPFITAIGMFSRPLDTSLLNQTINNSSLAELLHITQMNKNITKLSNGIHLGMNYNSPVYQPLCATQSCSCKPLQLFVDLQSQSWLAVLINATL